MKNRLLLLPVIVCSALWVAWACGDDDDSEDEPTPTETATPDETATEAPDDLATAAPTEDNGDSEQEDGDGGTPEDSGDGGDGGQVINLVVYYPAVTAEGYAYVPVERQIEDTPRVGTAALELLVRGPTTEEASQLNLTNPIPAGTEVLSLNIEDGFATADFSEELLGFSGGDDTAQAIAQMITRTLTQFPTVSNVGLLVEGEEAEALEPIEEAELVNIVLYFPRVTTQDIHFIAVDRQVEATPRVGTAALELLLEGFTSEEDAQFDLYDPIPDGTRLLSLVVEDGVARADFSAELLNYGGGAANVQAITGMIGRTLAQFPTVDEVVILVEGEEEQIQP